MREIHHRLRLYQLRCSKRHNPANSIDYKCSAVAEMGDRLATIDMGRKFGVCPLFVGGLGLHLTQCRLGRCLPPYQVASWSIQPFGHSRHGPKIERLCSFGGVGAGSPSNAMSPGPMPTSVPSGILIHPTGWPQYTNVTDRQNNGPIA